MDALAARVAEHQLGGILLTLGPTCVPNWRAVVDAAWNAAPTGTRLVILAIYSQRLERRQFPERDDT